MRSTTIPRPFLQHTHARAAFTLIEALLTMIIILLLLAFLLTTLQQIETLNAAMNLTQRAVR